ncbi:endonuclease/exonuclease/phosphatase family protein [Galbibacter sp.]|jgi:endonuclease/exonuclease/phosphatase family metal-dependent hydrolase|uniref:endonuclease/exonuclease/phosphatase family protein n=1 Tax=Galbibacter sp. TaxID=2918471 RepID=UPI003A94C1D7
MRILNFILATLICGVVSAQDLKVMSYNIKYDNPSDTANNWENRKAFLISQLNYYDVDVIGTQEGLHHQLEDIKSVLKPYDYVGIGRDKGNTEGEYSAIFYNTDELMVVKQGTFWLSPTPDKPSKGWDAALNRICTYALFKDKDSDHSFWVFNTHFDHRGDVARLESSKLILQKIKEVNKENRAVVLTGDFNLTDNEKGIQIITDQMLDTHTVAGDNAFGPKGTFNGFHFEKPVTEKIDYVFISENGFKVLKSGILSDSQNCKYPSDHFPVLVDLDFDSQEVN